MADLEEARVERDAATRLVVAYQLVLKDVEAYYGSEGPNVVLVALRERRKAAEAWARSLADLVLDKLGEQRERRER